VEAARVLRPHGWLLLELGYNSLGPVRAMLESSLSREQRERSTWTDIDVVPDLAGFPRVLAARLAEHP
jgi:hypothetical protein